jgi:hypothetical protein
MPSGPFADIDFLDEVQGGRIEHRHFVLAAVTRESVFELRRDRDPVCAGVSGIVPRCFPLSVSMTSTCVACEM